MLPESCCEGKGREEEVTSLTTAGCWDSVGGGEKSGMVEEEGGEAVER